MSKMYLTIEEAARRLRVTPGTLHNRLARKACMPVSIRIGRRRLFPEDEFEKWMMSFTETDQIKNTNLENTNSKKQR